MSSPGHLLDITVSSSMAFTFTFLGLLSSQSMDSRDGFVPNRVSVDSEYDFIVVGAGASGSVLANRLSEVSSWKILLLEAGKEESLVSLIPALAPLLANSEYDWKYKTEVNPNFCIGLVGGRCHFVQGKGMGGGTMINYMLHVRGNRKDYDTWEALGNPGWSYKEVLPYFLKSEDNGDFEPSPYHSRGGYLPAQRVSYETPLGKLFLRAGEEMEYQVRDVNGKQQTGFMKPQTNTRGGERYSNNRAFLRPVRSRPNLHVAKMAYVHRVLIDPKLMRAMGVVFRRNNVLHTVSARKEVILSAGALSSPKILMLSGIGPELHLRQMGLTTLKNLSGVGSNLQDHVGPGGLNYVINSPLALVPEGVLSSQTMLRWWQSRNGTLTLPGGVDGIAFVNSKLDNASADHPDIQFHFAATSVGNTYGVLARAHGLSKSVFGSVYRKQEGVHSWTVIPVLLRPKSRGHLRLRSTDPEHPPYIFPNYFQHPDDLKVLVQASRMVHRMSQTKAFRSVGSRFWEVPLPGCATIKMYTDQYWECHMRHYMCTMYHPAGTCKMGPKSDPEAVVDSRLRVHGVAGLRVVDASIMPNIVSGNTAVPCTMIGERAAGFIKEDWLLQR